MQVLVLALALLPWALLGSAAPVEVEYVARCKNPPVRKEWRQLTLKQRSDYINAVLCLTKKKAITKFPGVKNRFDDFHGVHKDQTPNIHWVGFFALWHRYLLAGYEKALRDECGYTGGQPYWDWSIDASSTNFNSTAVFKTAIFDPNTGFGGNGPYVELTPDQNPLSIPGHTGGGCVQDGPFTSTNFKVNVPTTGCLKRDFSPYVMNWFGQRSLVNNVLSQPDYTAFAFALEGIPSFSAPNIHGSGHFGIGGVLGTMGEADNSPGDPLFYLHHGNLDHILWMWQQKDLQKRLNQVGGPILPFDYSGKNVTLDFKINLGPLAANATLKTLLDTQGGTLCYTY